MEEASKFLTKSFKIYNKFLISYSSTYSNLAVMKPDFSTLAPFYDLLGTVVFFGALRRSQNYFLRDLGSPSKVLILGGGTGTYLIDLLKTNDIESVDYVDISPGMIEKAERKFVKSGSKTKVSFHCGGADVIPQKKYDLIITNYFLDCFTNENLKDLIPALYELLTPDGKWLFTDFHKDESTGRIKRGLIRFLYGFFNQICNLGVKKLPDFNGHFEKADLKVQKQRFFSGKLLRTVLFTKT